MYIRTSVGKLSKFRVEAEGGKKDIPTFSHVKAKRTQRVVFKSASAYIRTNTPVSLLSVPRDSRFLPHRAGDVDAIAKKAWGPSAHPACIPITDGEPSL